ncbi:unnamed protein product [Soboliphyme baturini]|uniref:Metallophos domain-containing protein n=1 Tax=Soboliphyme baturini TaxID=241478 RepID=A0A183IVM7_9BILA|nr:unnamed protein product [Soboliphyme baturini]
MVVGSMDTFEILIATDIHIGFAEKDPVRRDDSINTFEEVLQIAQKRNVDLVLLGGDLFHESKPSRYCLYRCMELLRKYCLSDRPVCFELVSENEASFAHSAFAHVNYEDSNLNVGLPVFTIHGNHDDIGSNGLGAMDLLHVSGLVNYFGKNTTMENVTISPLLLRKGNTTLALYGLGAMKDDRLHRLFLDHKVSFSKLQEGSSIGLCFSMMVIHQNRARHNVCNWIPESMLPDFLDLVVWGHEHPCLIGKRWVCRCNKSFIIDTYISMHLLPYTHAETLNSY